MIPRQPNSQISFQKGGSSHIKYLCGSMQGWRAEMEDTHICEVETLPGSNSLFAVFDGHGGKQVSLFASQNFLPVLVGLQQYQSGHYREALTIAFQKLDSMMMSHTENKLGSGPQANKTQRQFGVFCGCTGNVILLTKDKMYVANCGDSRSAMISLEDPSAYLELSLDHKPESAEEKARILGAGGFISNSRVNGNLNLSRSLGDFYYKRNDKLAWNQQLIICQPDVLEFDRPKQAIILQGCDGIWEYFQQSSSGLLEIVKSDVRMGVSLEDSVRNLLGLLLSKSIIETKGKGCDNMTSTMIQL